MTRIETDYEGGNKLIISDRKAQINLSFFKKLNIFKDLTYLFIVIYLLTMRNTKKDE